MTTALVIGGTGFVGRHVVADLLEAGYEVAVVSRGRVEVPPRVERETTVVEADRADEEALASAVRRTAPGVVIDCAAFHPDHARAATSVFADVDAYVYVSSGGVYARHEIPKRESVTPLHEYSPEQGEDRSMATYGPRKAECDRIVRAAADGGVPATCVRPTMVYGPKTAGDGAPGSGSVSWAEDVPGIQNHHEYWIHRVGEHDRVVVPGDGTAIWHRAYVEDVAAACRAVAESGTPGEAYNVADRRVLTVQDVVELIADVLGTEVEVVHASRRELAGVGLDPDDFVLYHHLGSQYPHVLSTCKLAALGWDSTPVAEAMERTVEEALESDRDGSAFDPGRALEERFLETVADA